MRVLLDGHWKALSTSGFFRLANLSVGGCFLQAYRVPPIGQSGTLTIYFKHDGPMMVDGEIVHSAPKKGFAIRFAHLTSSHQFQLGIQLETLKDEEHADRFPVEAYMWSSRGAQPTSPTSAPAVVEEKDASGKTKTRTRGGAD